MIGKDGRTEGRGHLSYDLGIDVGTAFTCAAIARDGSIEVFNLGTRSSFAPSVVSFREDGRAIVGEAAQRRLASDPSRTVRDFKRRIGDDSPYIVGGTPHTSEDLVGIVIADVVERVTAQEGEPPRRIALTHPANYGSHKLDRLRAAAETAGVTNAVLVPEPVAAALAYGEREHVAVGSYAVVYDFGGGTFDAAVIRRDADGPTLVGAAEGLERLGGVDLDEDVIDHVDRSLDGRVRALESGTPEARASLARLRDEARDAKEALSTDTDTDIPVVLPDGTTTIRLTRTEFEQAAAPRVEQTLGVLDRVVQAAALTWPDIAAVLLVGGSSRMPLVAERVGAHTRRPVSVAADPKAVVAIGAAMLASRLSDAADAAAAAAVALASAEVTDAAPVVAAPTRRTNERHGGRRAVVVAAILLGVLAIGGAAIALLGGGGGNDKKVAATNDRVVTSTSTTTPETTVTTRAAVATPPATTRTTTPVTAATTAPRPTVSNVSASPSTFLTCSQATTAGNAVTVSWTTANAATVEISIDGPGVYQSNLPPSGSTKVPAPCSDTQQVTVTGIGANGTRSDPKTITITIGAQGT